MLASPPWFLFEIEAEFHLLAQPIRQVSQPGTCGFPSPISGRILCRSFRIGDQDQKVVVRFSPGLDRRASLDKILEAVGRTWFAINQEGVMRGEEVCEFKERQISVTL